MRLGDDDVLVVDCREDESFGALSIPGALRMTLDDLATDAEVLPDDELIVLCGATEDLHDSERAWRMLAGTRPRTVCLRGGLRRWRRAGLPLEPLSGAFDPDVEAPERQSQLSLDPMSLA